MIKQELQKQNVVDALSLKESSINHGFYDTSPSLQLSKPKFTSLSLPNSANSSPLFTSKRKPKGEVVESPNQASNLTLKLLQEIDLRKSKSCGEGRASLSPFDEFDRWLIKTSVVEHDNEHHVHESFSKTEAIEEIHVSDNELETNVDEGFTCSALCMYLPGFGKAKSVKPKKLVSEMEGSISRTVSLEKFECGSWASSTLFNEIERDHASSYFDLPLELIRGSSVKDVHAPITSAFVFETDLKGVLKNGSSRTNARKLDISPHHVRFSMSSSISHYPPSPAFCNTPNLTSAKDDFNAFLEAQST
ncbi:uncharacterized protein LOC123922885 [Trifolium pratense]|uniref:uncharacterized protein LOC123922885 n=1 Tax=Trifolium pratense TaxID=57577 RepID=UPI001E693D8A|nr:uncharacterized protein LOC123922885 [Trifolium pratense]